MSVATTGAQVVYNRYNLEKTLNDHVLTLKAYRALYVDSKEFTNTNIVISTYNGEMLLAGQAPQSWQIKDAEIKIKKIPGIKKLYNVVNIQSPSSALTRVSDTWITTKIKSKIIASNEVDATQIKVLTENGIVYLMGALPPSHADLVTQMASDTTGVLRVVKIFSYVTYSKRYSQLNFTHGVVLNSSKVNSGDVLIL